MRHKLSLIIIALAGCLTAHAYVTAPSCPDFTNINASYVEAFTGFTENPFMTVGVMNGRHTVISTQGTDPRTGGALALLPAGESKVVKLGNEQVGGQAEALSYHFIVDADYPVLLVKFAVVLEDPGHSKIQQPRFVIRITDSGGNLTESCAEYDVSARPDIPGFQSYQQNAYVPIRWRDWTNVGLDMSQFIGQEVQVQFITYDCSPTGHFGYAYFTASCISNRLQLDGCTGTQFTLEAPDNFESYRWSNGATTRTTTFNSTASNNSQITCIVTSATGCQFPLYAYITTNAGEIMNGSYQDIICEGETYNQHHFDLPPQEAGVHHYSTVFVNPANCTDGASAELELTVVQRYNRITAAICHGEDYIANGFTIIKPAVGLRRDTILTGTYNGCNVYDLLELTVSANLNMPDLIQGDTSPCTGELVTYSFAGAETLTSFQWILPENAKFYQCTKYSKQITIYFTDDNVGTLSLKGLNGCYSGITTLQINPRKTHNIKLNKDICQGESFNEYNFNLGVQNIVGFFAYEKHLTSSLGCDSTVVLALNVLPTPKVRIEPDTALLCNAGDKVTLWAMTDLAVMPPCGDYETWYNTLTPAPESDFGINMLGSNCGIYYYYGAGGNVIVPSKKNGITVIGVFMGNSTWLNNITEIVLPPTATNFYLSSAFCDLTYVTIPPSVSTISITNLSNFQNLTIRCYENSYAHQYAIDNNIPFELILDCSEYNTGNNNTNCQYIPCGDYDEWYNTLTPNAEGDFGVGYVIGDTTCTLSLYNNASITKIVIPTKILNKTLYQIAQINFFGIPVTEVVIPSTVINIHYGAFKDNPTLTCVSIPNSVTFINSNAFENSPNVIIRCYENSYAHQYAINNDIPFELIGNCNIIPCGDYETWYNTLTPNAESDFATQLLFDNNCYIHSYTGAGGKVIIPSQINGNNVYDIFLCYDVFGFNNNVTEIILPPTAVYFGGLDCSSYYTDLIYITIPQNFTSLQITDIYSNIPNLIIRCYENSYAHQYAINNDIPFELIEDCPDTDNNTNINIYDCDCDYLWSNGSTEGFITVSPTATTEYSVTVTTKNGCIGTAKKTVVVNSIIPQTVYETICEGETYTNYGLNKTTSGVYPVTIHQDDCDIEFNVNLTVNPAYHGKITDVVCAGEPYSNYGLNFTLIQEGVFRDTLHFLRSSGCDSIVALEITVLPSVYTLLRDTVCQYQIYNKNNFILPIQEIAGEFTHTKISKTQNNCDSTIILTLTVNPVITNIISDEAKRDSVYSKYGFYFSSVTQDTTKTITGLINSRGCDSTVIINLTINAPYLKNETLLICENEFPAYWNDTVFDVGTESGTYIFNKNDSTIILEVKINPVYFENETMILCASELPIYYLDTVFAVGTQSGIYVLNRKTAAGCDSIVTLDLTVKPAPDVNVVEKNVCQNDTVHLVFTGVAPFNLDYIFNGINENITVYGMDTTLIATQAGENIFVIIGLTSANGCDFYPPIDTEPGVDINGIIWSTRNVNTPGTFVSTPETGGMLYQWGRKIGWSASDPLINSDGGTVWNLSFPSGTSWALENDPCPCGWRVPTVDEQGNLLSSGDNLTTSNGVNGRRFGVEPNTVFLPYAGGWRNPDGSFYIADHNDYWTSTNYNSIEAYDLCFDWGYSHQIPADKRYAMSIRCVKTAATCQLSTDTVMVHTAQANTVIMSICTNDSALFNGNYYYQTGIYIDTLSTEFGCDSVVTLDLTVDDFIYKTINASICPNEEYNFYGNIYTEAGTYKDTVTATINCDSVITLNLTVLSTIEVTVEETICSGESYIFNGIPRTESGVYLGVFTGINGCDSTVTLILDVIEVDALVKISSPICADDKEFYFYLSKLSDNTILPTHYKIEFPEKAVPSGWSNFVNQQGIITSDTIVVDMPEKVYPDHYSCTLTLSHGDYAEYCPEKPYHFNFTVLYPDTIMEQKWDDVVALLNEFYNGGFKYAGYQWYRNGIEMVGEDYSYIYIRNGNLIVGDEYSVLITREDGSQIFSCPLVAKDPRPECCDYPTIVNGGGVIKISLPNKTATVRLITVTGIVLSTHTFNSEYEFIAPTQQGVYLLEIISDNKTREVGKIIVK